MKHFLIISLLFSFSIAFDFDRLGSFDCRTQSFDFQIEAIQVIQEGQANKKLYASFYKSYSKRCALNSKDWCLEYHKVSEKDYFTYKNLALFQCGALK